MRPQYAIPRVSSTLGWATATFSISPHRRAVPSLWWFLWSSSGPAPTHPCLPCAGGPRSAPGEASPEWSRGGESPPTPHWPHCFESSPGFWFTARSLVQLQNRRLNREPGHRRRWWKNSFIVISALKTLLQAKINPHELLERSSLHPTSCPEFCLQPQLHFHWWCQVKEVNKAQA